MIRCIKCKKEPTDIFDCLGAICSLCKDTYTCRSCYIKSSNEECEDLLDKHLEEIHPSIDII